MSMATPSQMAPGRSVPLSTVSVCVCGAVEEG